MRTSRHITLGVALLGALAAAVLPACRGDRNEKPPRRFFPDMDKQPRWNPQDHSNFYVDGRTQRVPDDRAVAYGYHPTSPATLSEASWGEAYLGDRAALLAEDDAYYRGIGADGDYVPFAPVQPTAAMIDRGQERFNIYCSACHGYLGDGKGTVGERWSYPPANLMGELYTNRAERQGKDGYLFHVIREGVWGDDGVNRMPSYKHAVDQADAWAIVLYLRSLQRSQNATLDDLESGERSRLESTRGAAPEGGA
ncbi:MAG: cytochrome c [Phycisphaerales bacterium]